MKRILALAALAPLVFATVAADDDTTEATPAPACDRDAGRESLGFEGLHVEMSAPGAAAPELAATHDVTGDLVTPYRTHTFPLVLDVAPYAAAQLDVALSWTNPSDYDVYLYAIDVEDGEDWEYVAGSSDTANLEEEGGPTFSESFTTEVADCTQLRLVVRNWAGNPAETMALDVDVTPAGDPVAELLPREDTRTALYLAGDRPGQLGTIQQGSLGNTAFPLSTAFSTERPSDNVPNQITRAVAGSDIERNEVQPYWAGQFDETDVLDGQASAVVWLSSATQEHAPGAVEVSLFVNGTETSVEIPGELIGRDPAPFFVTFPYVFEDEPLWTLTFQATTLPQASPNAASEHPGDAQHTVLYDSLQFQSAVYLPTTG